MAANVVMIPPRNQDIILPTIQKKIRVAAYCRVSTGTEEQLNSYFHQISYYVNKIEAEEEWEFVDLYADEGLSGTKVKYRDDFNRMMDDCRKGLIDLILVKSISRFARNTLDCLNYIRELRALNVDVYFENENIHSIDMASEFIISIYAMHAQEQSISTSNNKRWSIKKSMKNGTWLPTFIGYGYMIKDDELVKDVAVAEIVDLIKNLYLDGYSTFKIVEYLEENGIPSPKGNRNWNTTVINTILQNPIYRGHVEAQKTFTTDSFPFERRLNHGEHPKYYYYDDHEAYINKEEAEKIDQIMVVRRELNGSPKCSEKKAMRNYLSGKVICDECGSKMKRSIYSYSKVIAYNCHLHVEDKTQCSNQAVLESTIQDAFVKVCNKLKYYHHILDDYLHDLYLIKQFIKSHERLNELTSEYQLINKQIQQTAVSYNRGLCESAFYVQEIKRLKEKKIKILQQKEKYRDGGYQNEIENTKMIQDMLSYYRFGDDFDEHLFTDIVDHVSVIEQTKVTFHFINGLSITEKMEV